MNPSVDGYIRKNKQWAAELTQLREIILSTPLVEEIKWRQPCYTHSGHNVVIIGAQKTCCVLSFFKGALLKDAAGILVKPGENTQAGRTIRFSSVDEIVPLTKVLTDYIFEAIAIEESGERVEMRGTEAYPYPDELRDKMAESPEFARAFEALTPGRQHGYLLHFSAAKQSKTRQARIEKYMPQILEGRGMLDDYKEKVRKGKSIGGGA